MSETTNRALTSCFTIVVTIGVLLALLAVVGVLVVILSFPAGGG